MVDLIVDKLLEEIGLNHAIPNFTAAGIVTPAALAEVEPLCFEALGITNPDDRRKLFFLIQRLKLMHNNNKKTGEKNDDEDFYYTNDDDYEEEDDEELNKWEDDCYDYSPPQQQQGRTYFRRTNNKYEDNIEASSSPTITFIHQPKQQRSPRARGNNNKKTPKKKKTLAETGARLYIFGLAFVTLITCLQLVNLKLEDDGGGGTSRKEAAILFDISIQQQQKQVKTTTTTSVVVSAKNKDDSIKSSTTSNEQQTFMDDVKSSNNMTTPKLDDNNNKLKETTTSWTGFFRQLLFNTKEGSKNENSDMNSIKKDSNNNNNNNSSSVDSSSSSSSSNNEKINLTPLTKTSNPEKASRDTLFPPFIFSALGDNKRIPGEKHINTCKNTNKHYNVQIYDTQKRDEFMRNYYPEFVATYDKLPSNLMRAELWSYLVLHKFGGVYLDMDVDCKKPIDIWADFFSAQNKSNINAMVGYEFCDFGEAYNDYSGVIQFLGWTMAGEANHPIFYYTAQLIKEIMSSDDHQDLLEQDNSDVFISGSVTLTKTILEYMRIQGHLKPEHVLSRKGMPHEIVNASHMTCNSDDLFVGDLAILNKQAFGYHKAHPGSPSSNSPLIKVRHYFEDKWDEPPKHHRGGTTSSIWRKQKPATQEWNSPPKNNHLSRHNRRQEKPPKENDQPITEDHVSFLNRLDNIANKSSSSSVSSTRLFPPFIFQTASDKYRLPSESKGFSKNCDRKNNPHYKVEIFDNTDAQHFVHEHYPEFADLYDNLPKSVMRADLWRYLVLHHFGGVYLDVDVDCIQSVETWANFVPLQNRSQIKAMVGYEFCDFHDTYGNNRNTKSSPRESTGRIQFVQWTMASQPKHPIFYKTAERIKEIMSTDVKDLMDHEDSAVHMTGPIVFSKVVLEYIASQGYLYASQILAKRGEDLEVVNATYLHCDEDLLVGDLAILNKQAFGFHKYHPGSPIQSSPLIKVRHHFKGSWRVK